MFGSTVRAASKVCRLCIRLGAVHIEDRKGIALTENKNYFIRKMKTCWNSYLFHLQQTSEIGAEDSIGIFQNSYL
jgi:hypothetical protein